MHPRSPSPLAPRLRAAAAVALVSLLALSACAADTTAETTPAGGTSSGAYPMTLETPHGDSVLEAAPTRVVAFSSVDLDIAVALGVVPVAAPDPTYGDLTYIAEGIERASKAGSPTEVEGWLDPYATDEPAWEQLAALKPDVILATSDWSLSDNYERLSEIAPVVGYTVDNGADAQPWQDKLELIATALDREAEGTAVLAQVDSTFADAAAANPQFAEKSLTYAVHFPDYISFESSTDGVGSAFFDALGFQASPRANDFSPVYPENEVSLESIDALEADVLVMGFHEGLDAESRTAFEDGPLFSTLEVVQRGDTVVLPEYHSSNIVYPAPLLLLAELDTILPLLQEAVPAS